jgi:hypothetical protein
VIYDRPSPDFDTILAHGASHRYAGGESAVIEVVTGAALSLTSGHVHFDYPLEPTPGYYCPLKQNMLPETPPVPPGRYPVHLIVADITDAAGGPDVISKVAAVRLVVRDEPAVAWEIHEDYPDGLITPRYQPHFDNIAGLTDCQMCGTFDNEELNEFSRQIGDRAGTATASNFNHDSGPGPLVDQHLPPWPIEDAMVMFPTGWAHGDYRTWAGRGADGGLVCLLTDFEVLSENVGPKPPRPAPAPVQAGSVMLVGQTLRRTLRRQSLNSPSGSCWLLHQDDGDLVLYRNELGNAVPLWASNTHGTSVGDLELQDDGNLVLYDRDRRAVWATGTAGQPVARLAVRDERTVVLEAADGSELWSSAA